MAIPQTASLLRLLPTEIVDTILEMLDRKDLFIVRLTCKALCSLATPMAFDELYVWLERESLQRLVNIARHPQLRTHVNLITFGLERFYDVDLEQFEDDICSGFSMDERTSTSDEPQDTSSVRYEVAIEGVKKDAWSVYRRCYERQCTLDQSNTDAMIMTEALEAFVSLRKIDMGDALDIDYRQASSRIKREGLILDKMLILPPFANNGYPRGGRQLYVLLRALAGRSKSLENFSLELYASCMSTGGFYCPLSVDDVSLAIHAFVGLKRLSLRLQMIFLLITEQGRQPSNESPLTNILQAATRLEVLHVTLPFGIEFIWSAVAGCCWRDFIQVPCFGQLKELEINRAILTEAEFVAFLMQSCQCLKVLRLGAARVIEGTWASIFEAIRSLPALEDIALKHLWQELNEDGFYVLNGEAGMDPEPLYDFLLRRREDNPWLRMCQEQVAQNKRGKVRAIQSAEGNEG